MKRSGHPVTVFLLLLALLTLTPPAVRRASSQSMELTPIPFPPGTGLLVHYRLDDREIPLGSGDWVPSSADLLIRYDAGEQTARSYRLEVLAIQDGRQVPVEVPGIQEFDKATRKWVYTSLEPAAAQDGRWIWGGTFRPGDEVVIRWRDADSGSVLPHPMTLRFVEAFGARLAFSTPVSIVFPRSGDPAIAASAGFSLRYYRTSNTRFWRALDRIGFPAVGLAYASMGGEKSILYSIGFSMVEDQIHLYYGGYRNSATANNFWMFGIALKTNDLVSAARKVVR